MHGFLDPLTNESFLTLDFGQGLFDFLIDSLAGSTNSDSTAAGDRHRMSVGDGIAGTAPTRDRLREANGGPDPPPRAVTR